MNWNAGGTSLRCTPSYLITGGDDFAGFVVRWRPGCSRGWVVRRGRKGADRRFGVVGGER